MPLWDGTTGNITNKLQFVASQDLHLIVGSPCIDAGTNMAWMVGAVHLDGRPRSMNGHVDIGAYEHDAATADSDGDGMKEGDEVLSSA